MVVPQTINPVGGDNRIHVGPQHWADDPATDFWVVAGAPDSIATAGATNPSGLSGWGWTVTSLAHVEIATGDFMSAADDTPQHFLTDANADLIVSPLVFGSYAHAIAAGAILGYPSGTAPDTLELEFHAAFTVASADEAGSLIGFVDTTAAALVGAVYSNGTNFLLSNGSATITGPAIDTAFHLWKISISRATGLMELFVDGVSYGTLAVAADKWPCGFGMTASTTNRPGFSFAHVRYA